MLSKNDIDKTFQHVKIGERPKDKRDVRLDVIDAKLSLLLLNMICFVMWFMVIFLIMNLASRPSGELIGNVANVFVFIVAYNVFVPSVRKLWIRVIQDVE